MDRYSRQNLLGGWQQQRLSDATIAIAGSGPLAFLVGLMAAAMGMGRLAMLGAGKGQSMRISLGEGSWAELYRRVNPQVRVYAAPTRLSLGLLRRLPALDGLVVAGNDLEAHAVAQRAAREFSIPIVAGATAGHLGVWGRPVPTPALVRLCAHQEFPLLSQVVAGLLVEEMRKALLPLSGESGPSDRSNFLCLPVPRQPTNQRRLMRTAASQNLVLVGAGALGTWFGMAMGMAGLPVGLHLYDDDEVSETNLNRQVLFYDAVGENKATVLAARLQGLFPHLKVYGYGARADSNTEEFLTEHPTMVACPDSFAARAYLNGLAKKRGRMLVSGGTSASGGSCLIYESGRTACLDCRLRIDQLAQVEAAPQSCARQAQPSIVTSNAMVGALMALLLHERLGTGRPQAGMWEYDGRPQHTRLRLGSEWPACECHLPPRRRRG